MSQEQADKLKAAIKSAFKVNKEGEVELNDDLLRKIAGGVTPEQQEEEDINVIACKPNLGCSPT